MFEEFLRTETAVYLVEQFQQRYGQEVTETKMLDLVLWRSRQTPVTMGPASKQYLESSAVLSADGRYRYELARQLSHDPVTVLFIGLNPSTATAAEDDPTVRREVAFARRWGFGRYVKANLYALRSTHPSELKGATDPVGPENAETLRRLVHHADRIVAAWGATALNSSAHSAGAWICSLEKTHCLGLTKGGQPKHPLRLRKDTPLMPLRG